MPGVYWFFAPRAHPQTKAPLRYPPGIIISFVIAHPGNALDAVAWVQQSRLGSPGVRYHVEDIPTPRQIPQPCVLCWQTEMGVAQVGPAQPVLSGQHVQGGAPVGVPHSRGNEPGGAPDPVSGFETLAGSHLDSSAEGYYVPDDGGGTVSDLINEGGAVREVQRNV